VSTPEVIGVQSLEDSYYVIRVIAETLPVYQWAGARVIRQEIKDNLYAEGIEIPSPRLMMYSRNEEPSGVEIGDHKRQAKRSSEGLLGRNEWMKWSIKILQAMMLWR